MMILPIFIGGGMAVSDRALARIEVGAACVFILAVVVAISVGVYLGNYALNATKSTRGLEMIRPRSTFRERGRYQR